MQTLTLNYSERIPDILHETRKQFEKEGYILLSKEYKNSKQKLDVICPKGHEWSVSWCGFRQGYRCPECVGVKKKTIEYVRKHFEKDKKAKELYNMVKKQEVTR